MLAWLLVYGTGGCWSGYTDAIVIFAEDRDTAMTEGARIAFRETAEERGYSHGCSYDVELILGDVRQTSLYQCRCKPGAKVMAELAFDDIEVAHG